MTSYELDGIRITINPDTLRERAEDAAALAAWCAGRLEDPLAVPALRILGRLEEAEALGLRALHEGRPSALARAARRARLAHVWQWQGRFEEADEAFTLAAEETGLEDPTSRSSLLLLATVLQHRAKSRFEQAQASAEADLQIAADRQWDAALEDAERALAIRCGLDAAEDLIASARETVERLRRRG